MRKIIIISIFIISFSLFSQNKQALLIGNSNYIFSPLKNPTNDTNDFASILKELDFNVTVVLNGSKKEIIQSIRKFKSTISAGDIALFYYSGHGVQIDGANYLLPVGANIIEESEAEFEAVEMNYVFSSLENSGSAKNILIFDACRNNTLKKSHKSTTRGLAVVSRELPESIIIYSTAPGKVAFDGDGRNSPFIESLLKNINIPNQTLNSLIMKVTKDVKTKTSTQVPWRTSNLTEEFYFVKSVRDDINSKVNTSDTIPVSHFIEKKGRESGNSHTTLLFTNSSDIGRSAYFPICDFMPLPSVISEDIYNNINGDITGFGEEGFNKTYFDKYYYKNNEQYILKYDVAYIDRPDLWAILKEAQYDIFYPEYKEKNNLKEVKISFEVRSNTNGSNSLKNIQIVTSSGNKDIDNAVKYGFKQSTYNNDTDLDIKGEFIYQFW